MGTPLIRRDRRLITGWLAVCLLLVASMVLVGGYTRLSGSGLSIVEWKPAHGAIPPLNEAMWDEEFTAYRTSPQYRKIHRGMTLAEFKTIFWPEYFHRLLGRAVGLVFLAPFLIFILRQSLTPRLSLRLAGIFALGGLQGVIGWLMVKSGLINDPHVSHLRLALHLSVAFMIFGLLLWTWLDAAASGERQAEENSFLSAARHTATGNYLFWLFLLCLQIVLGALVAGLHAGLIHNTWPTMNGAWVPEGLLAAPLIENVTLIQFLHRTLAVIVAAGFVLWWYLCRVYVKDKALGRICCGVMCLMAFQFLGGVLTLLHAVPLPLALAHQTTGLLLFGVAVVLLHGLRHDRLREPL